MIIQCNDSGIAFEGRKNSKYAPEIAKLRKEAFRYNWLKEYELLAQHIRMNGESILYSTPIQFVSLIYKARKNTALVQRLLSEEFAKSVDTSDII